MNRSNTVKRTFFKAYVVVNVHHLSSGHVNQNVVKVTVAKANNVSHHWHDSSRSGVGLQTEKRKHRNIWITFLSICPFLKQETRKKVRNALNASPRTWVTLHHSLGVVQEHQSSLDRRLDGVASINSFRTSFITLRGQSLRVTSTLSPTAFRAGPMRL